MTTQWGPRLTYEQTVSVTPTVSTTPAYTSGDQVGGIMTLANVTRLDTASGIGTAQLTEVTILDAGKQSAAFNIWLFSALPTIASSDNAAFDLTDAQLALNCIGYVAVGTTYATSTSNAVSSTTNINKQVHALTGTTIYAVAQTTSTPTYASTTDLQFQFKFLVD